MRILNIHIMYYIRAAYSQVYMIICIPARRADEVDALRVDREALADRREELGNQELDLETPGGLGKVCLVVLLLCLFCCLVCVMCVCLLVC